MESRRIGNYRIVDYVGGGGFGSVFKAEDVSAPGRVVAVKELHKKHTRSPVIKQRFFQEAVAMARLDHPNLPRLYTFGEDNGVYYLVMEFLSGKLLSEEIAENGSLSAARAVAIIAQVLEGVSYAHRNEIIHRDLKPENIMLLDDGSSTVKILDFGIARMVGGENLTMAGEGFGTPAYMSPERIAGNLNVDQSTDIYSAGIMLFEMLSGKTPFESTASDPAVYWSEMRDFHSGQNLPSLVPLGIPEELDEVIKKATAKRPGDRFATADEMLAALRSVEDENVSAGLAARTARLLLTTVPAGAEVFVDNIKRGVSDERGGKLLIEELASGLHRVRVSKAGYSDYKINVSLEDGHRTDLQVALPARATVPIPPPENTGFNEARTVKLDKSSEAATVIFEDVPAGSTVFIGSEAAALSGQDGRATLELVPGVHDIRISSPNGATGKGQVTITHQDSGSLKTMTLPLTVASEAAGTSPVAPDRDSRFGSNIAKAAAAVLLLALVATAYFVLRGPSPEDAATAPAVAENLQPQDAATQTAPQSGAQPQPGMSAAQPSAPQPPPLPPEPPKAGVTPTEKKQAQESAAGTEAPTAPSVPTDPSQAGQSRGLFNRACVVVTVLGPGGRPMPRVRVGVVEQPGTDSERMYGGLTAENGKWRTCGPTAGRQAVVSVMGPRRSRLGNKRIELAPGMNEVVIQLDRDVDVTTPDEADRRRPPRRPGDPRGH